MERSDDFNLRRKHLENLDETELEKKFWQLAFKITKPMVDMARTHTSPSIERSVLMRMGFSSMEGKSIVEGCLDRGLLGKGAGHVVLKVARDKKITVRDAGTGLLEDRYWDRAEALFDKTGEKA